QTTKSKNWISVSYIKCLEKELLCECQKKEKHSLIRLDSNYVTIYGGIIYDPDGGYLKKTANNSYQVYYTKYITNLFKDSVITMGTIQIIGNTLYYTDNTKTKTSFINYGSTN